MIKTSQPGKGVNPALLIDGGTPKVFYYGTVVDFDMFKMNERAYKTLVSSSFSHLTRNCR